MNDVAFPPYMAVGGLRENCQSIVAILSRAAKYRKYCRQIARPGPDAAERCLPTDLLLRRMIQQFSPAEGGLMRGEKKERWMALCEQAANEQDPEKLMALVAEIDRLLAEKQQRLEKQAPSQGNCRIRAYTLSITLLTRVILGWLLETRGLSVGRGIKLFPHTAHSIRSKSMSICGASGNVLSPVFCYQSAV
jgi:hypothetical protein